MDNLQNIIYIEFYDKKHFPLGEWSREPDYCEWDNFGFKCVAIRDMKLGTWKGFVGLTKSHPAFNKSLIDIFNEKWGFHILVHGGICSAGKLPIKSKSNNRYWWFGFECSQGEDLCPLFQDPLFDEQSSYKNILYVRKETNSLAQQLMGLKLLWEQQNL